MSAGARPAPDVRVGLAEAGEREAALAVWRAALAARRGDRPVPAHVEQRVRRYMDEPDAFLLVAREGSRVVGLSLGLVGRAADGAGPPVPGLCHISSVYVAPDRWGRGVGRLLVEGILGEARRRGFATAQLWTQSDNARALRLYTGRGFALTGREKPDTELGDTIVLLRRDL